MGILTASDVDPFLVRDDKTFANDDPWGQDYTSLSWRWTKKEILLQGHYSGVFVATIYPRIQPTSHFGILLVGPEMIWRVDHWPTAEHFNDFASPTGIPAGKISGPLYYKWGDNKHLMQDKVDPSNFKYARKLPDILSGWRSVFQWFLLETNISLPNPLFLAPFLEI